MDPTTNADAQSCDDDALFTDAALITGDALSTDAAPDAGTSAAPLCNWLVRLPGAGLVCSAHDQFTAPWCKAAGCRLPVACLCHVCAREAVPVAGRFSWSFLCRTCTRIERALAAPYGLGAATPHRGQQESSRETLFGHLHPERVDHEDVSIAVSDGGTLSVKINEVKPPEGSSTSGLVSFFRARTQRMGERFDHDVPWVQWQEQFPATAGASAEAYQRYITEVHPWIESVEPRVADLGWLTQLAEARA